MQRLSISYSLVLLLTTGALACACNQSAPGPKGPVAATIAASHSLSGTDPVAKIGSTTITMAELEEHVAPQLHEIEEQAFAAKKAGLEQMINQKLVQSAAFKKGMTEDQFLKDMVDSKITPTSDAAAEEFFKKNSAQLPAGAKFKDFQKRIVDFMGRQEQNDRAKEVFETLRKESNVQVLLAEPPKPRIEVEATGPSLGPKNAKITIVEFSDFECPFCDRGRQTIARVMAKYEGHVRLVFRQFPLSFHAQAKKAAEAGLCANAQGKFWPMHDAMFTEQKKLSIADLKAAAAKLGLDKDGG